MRNYYLLVVLLPVALFGKICEIGFFSDILPYVAENTWVICDIDNTLIETKQQLGSTQWGEHLCAHLQSSGKTEAEILKLEAEYWQKVVPYISVRPVEEQIPKIIQQLQEKGVVVLALTARHPNEADYTIRQLQSVGIHLQPLQMPLQMKECDVDCKLSLQSNASYYKGVLLCSMHHEKGHVLTHYLERINGKPKRILFIDDKKRHVENLEKTFSSGDIEFIGFRYAATDQRVQAFDSRITEMQYEALPHIISDEEASLRLQSFDLSK